MTKYQRAINAEGIQGGSMESRGKMGRGKGSGFDHRPQWGLGFLEASNVRVSGKLGLILEGSVQWGKFAAQSAFYPYCTTYLRICQ